MSRIWRLLLALAALAVVPIFAEAQAVGPVLGKECLITWIYPTTNTDGSAETLPMGFKRYDQSAPTPVPVPGTTVPVTNLAPPATSNAGASGSDPCGAASPGQHYSWGSVYNTNGESPLTAQVPWFLTLAAPSPVTAMAYNTATKLVTWSPPTTNADGTVLIGTLTGNSAPLSYLVYTSPTSSPAPVPGTTVPTATLSSPGPGVSAPATWTVPGTLTGQQYAWVAPSNANGIGAVQAAPLNLTPGVPNAPATGLSIK